MPTATGQAPNVQVLKFYNPAIATVGNEATYAIGEAPFTGSVTEVTYSPNADITGANTNTRRFALINKGADGNGTTVVAELQMNSGVNATDFDEKTITLSGTAANLDVTEGDILAWFSDAIGTGIADPGGLVQVSVSRA